MKRKKYTVGFLSLILAIGFLNACNGVDENEPDPTEEPSEQRQQNNQ